MAEGYLFKPQNMSNCKILRNINLTNKTFTISDIPRRPSFIFVVCSYSNIEDELISFAFLNKFAIDCKMYYDTKKSLSEYNWAPVKEFSNTFGFVRNLKMPDTATGGYDASSGGQGYDGGDTSTIPKFIPVPSSFSNKANMVYTSENHTLIVSDDTGYKIPAKSLYDIYVFY